MVTRKAHKGSRGPKVAIVMAVYSPDRIFLAEQIQSIFAQTYKNWHLFIFLDGSDVVTIRNKRVSSLNDLIPVKFKENVSVFSGARVGSYWNFERGLSAAVKSDADYFCFADQDDTWAPSKLSVQIQTMKRTKATLVHSDLTAVNELGELISDSVWRDEGRIDPITSSSLFTRNMVTGCTMLFSRNLAEAALPFPPQFKSNGTYWHHDYWIAMLACQQGVRKIVGISEPLVAYRKHGQNQIGYVPGVYFPRNLRQAVFDYRLRKSLLFFARLRISERTKSNNSVSISDLRLLIMTLRNAIRCYSIQQTRLAFLLSIANVISQIHSILSTARSFTSVLRVGLKKGYSFLQFHLRNNGSKDSIHPYESNRFSAIKSSREDSVLWVFIPTLQASSLFGGISTILNFSREATKLGKRVNIICTDVPILDDQSKTKNLIVSELQWKKWPSKLTVGSLGDLLTVGRSDVFMATAWWTKPICEKIREEVQFEIPIVYFIQDFEPLFYPSSEDYLSALVTYKDCSYSIVNSTLLADYLKIHAPSAMRNFSILAPQVIHPSSVNEDKSEPGTVSIFFYARPSVPRNMYNLGVQSLEKFLLTIPRSTRVVIHLAGETLLSVPQFTGAEKVYSHGKLTRSQYSELLQSTNIGLCLMASPHPSYPTLELVTHGAQSVTNSFGKFKKSNKLHGVIVVEPKAEDVAKGLEVAYQNSVNQKNRKQLHFSELGSELEVVVKELYEHLQKMKP